MSDAVESVEIARDIFAKLDKERGIIVIRINPVPQNISAADHAEDIAATARRFARLALGLLEIAPK